MMFCVSVPVLSVKMCVTCKEKGAKREKYKCRDE